MSLPLEAGEVDYFSAILAMQNLQPNLAMPEALSKEVKVFKDALIKEGVNWNWPKPVVISQEELKAFGAFENLTVSLKKDETQNSIIALSSEANLGLAKLLLGGTPQGTERAPSWIEGLISARFIKSIHIDFETVETPQTAIGWPEYVAAKLAFNERDDSAFIVFMINRRAEVEQLQEIRKTDIQQQRHIEQVIGNSSLTVDYVLGGGAVSLSLLRNLETGSVLPLGRLGELPVQARANGKIVFGADLDLTAESMKTVVSRIGSGARDDR